MPEIDYKLLLAKYMAVILRDECDDHLANAEGCSPGLTSKEDNKELLEIRKQLDSVEISSEKYDWSKFNAKDD